MLELENEAGPVPIIKKWPWPWPSAAAVGPHRSPSRSPDFDAHKSHPRNVAPPFLLSVLDAVPFVVRKQLSKKCISFVRTMTDPNPPLPRHLGCGCQFDRARVVVGHGAATLRNGALFVNHALASVVCLKRWSVKNGAQGVAPFVPNDGRFWAVALRLVKRVGYGRTILGVRYKRDSVPERTVGRPIVCPKRWSVQTDCRRPSFF